MEEKKLKDELNALDPYAIKLLKIFFLITIAICLFILAVLVREGVFG